MFDLLYPQSGVGTRFSSILVASDLADYAHQVRKVLSDKFHDVHISTDADRSIEDFERHKPQVIVLAFDTLKKAERYCQDLYCGSELVFTVAPRTIMLCNKEELSRVYDQCCRKYFDDYVVFWPTASDTMRLSLSVIHSLRDRKYAQTDALTQELAGQTRRIAELEAQLEWYADQHLQKACLTWPERAINEVDFSDSESRFFERFDEPQFGQNLDEHPSEQVLQADAHATFENLLRSPRGKSNPITPSRHDSYEWSDFQGFGMEAMGVLATVVGHRRPIVMIVDDDEFQYKIVRKILAASPYELLFAHDADLALNILEKTLPDLILLDVVMPSSSGQEILRWLKASPAFSAIPVIMFSGESQKAVVVECLDLGAVGFLAKPLDRNVLLKKLDIFLTA